MHVFVSDLHLTESDPIGSVASDARLTAFVDHVESLAEKRGTTVKLVFLGDIVELLRSVRWNTLWATCRSAPWSGMAPNFANFAGGHSEACALDVAEAVRARYPGFRERLSSAVQRGRIATTYVVGNHDYMADLSPRLRAVVADLLSLDHDQNEPFPTHYADDEASVYATHGHSYDPINWHRSAEGLWAMGDAVVLRVVNRFEADVCHALGLTPGTKLGRMVAGLDDVAALTDIPLYVRWIGETLLANGRQKATFAAVWREVVRDFLRLGEFADGGGYRGGDFDRLRLGLTLSIDLEWADFLKRFEPLFPKPTPDPSASARRLCASLQRRYRYVVFGHTHLSTLEPMGGTNERAEFYVNTGCWRRTMSRPPAAHGPFVARRVACWFTVDPAADADGERYRLSQEWHAS